MKLICALALVIIFFQDNEPPKVSIISPVTSANYQWGTALRYEVRVSDKEDGDSKYDEINPAEVLVEARAVSDNLQIKSYAKSRAPLQLMMSSNCMNCHTFRNKLIGPSFLEISNKKKNAEELVKHVKEGSKGVWGDVVMPSHPELQLPDIEKMVQWIMHFSEQKDVEFATGTTGSIRMQKPDAKKQKMLLTATYLDHQKAPGENHVVLDVKE
jgi:cytochrome c